MTEKKVIRKEIRFAVHLPKKDYREDTHYIKEHIYYDDGTSKWHTFLAENYQRPIWVSKPSMRSAEIKLPNGQITYQGGHRDKKEFELRENVLEQKCTQSDVNRVVAGMLGTPHLVNRPKELRASPYLYGYDQTSTSIIKLQSLMKNQFVQSPYTMAASDTETDIDTREILMITIAFQGRTYTCILKKYLEGKGIYDFDKQVRAAMDKYLPQYTGKLKSTFKIFEHEGDMLVDLFRVANEWGPDWLAYWNMNFDVPRIIERAEKLGLKPQDVFADKSVPNKFRFSRYKEGIKSKAKGESKKGKPVPPSLQWHSLVSTSSFYIIDPMCVYRQLRMAKQEEPSYGLDAILQKELGSRKLKFEEAEAYKGEKWHRFMQHTYPIEYIVYHLYDCLGMLELDAKLRDLSHSVPAFAGMTDFGKFNSNPKKIVDALFLFGLERGKVIGTTMPSKSQDEEAAEQAELIRDDQLEDTDDEDEEESTNPDDYKGLDLKGWIQLLPQNFLIRDGLKCLSDFPEVTTNIRGMVADLDATSAYPTATLVANVSKKTCVNEVIRIDGLSEETFREQNLSVCLGGVNTLEYMNVMFDLPAIDSEEMDALLADM